jgi:hypothetical protein
MSVGAAPVDPSTGLPVQGLGTHIAGKDSLEQKATDPLGAISLFAEARPQPPATDLPLQALETKSGTSFIGGARQSQTLNFFDSGFLNGATANNEKTLAYGFATNAGGADFSAFASLLPDQNAASDFQTRLRGIVNQAGASETPGLDFNGAQNKDFGVDGLRGWRLILW